MWDIVIHLIIGMVLGWYLFPFRENNSFRSKVNSIVMGLVHNILEMMNKEGKPVKATQSAPSQTPRRSYQPNQTYGGKVCKKCNIKLEQIVDDPYYKGYWFCPQCKTMEATK